MRRCGCDTDVRVFGHAYCVQQAWPYGKHLTCSCDRCPCTTCHEDR